ncbi:ras C3 botulinum toxin substrate 2 [Pelomyxa schiedti]|nr:ras C3 botulinum toxin substrate 2 [Pelomyxa schiedti]
MGDLKVVVVGDYNVGKTCLLVTYSSGCWPEGEHVPSEVSNHSSFIQLEDKTYTFTLWDQGGGGDHEIMRPYSYPGTSIFLICFSVTSRTSLENVRTKWYPEIRHHCPGTPFIIVGTKRDLRSNTDVLRRKQDRVPVSFEMASGVAREIHASAYIETSSLKGEHVRDLFSHAVRIAATGKTEIPRSSSPFSWSTLWNAVAPLIGSIPSSQHPVWVPLYSNVHTTARYGHTQVIHGTILYTAGGLCAKGTPSSPEVLRFELLGGSWLPPITARNDTSNPSTAYKGMTFAASVMTDNLMFLFGGRSNCYTNSLRCLNVTNGEWYFLPEGNSSESPSPRYGASMVAFSKCLFIFGGYDSSGMASEELKCYDLVAQSWIPVSIKPGQVPRGRFHHTAVCHNGKMILFGGIADNQKLNDLWSFDLSLRVWLKPPTQGTTPPPMRGHSAALIGDEMFVCTCNSSSSSMVLFRLRLGSILKWSLVDIGNTPPVREFHTLVSYEAGLILSGGRPLTPSGNFQGDAWTVQLFSRVVWLLPHELWINIFSYCDPKSLFRLSAVCRDFRGLASYDELWLRFLPTSTVESSSNKGFLFPELAVQPTIQFRPEYQITTQSELRRTVRVRLLLY